MISKQRILADALTRIGRFELAELPSVLASPQPYHYRSRTRVLVQGGLLGYRRRRSHRLCAIEACPVLAPAVGALLARFADSPETWGAELREEDATTSRVPVAVKTAVEEEWELCAGSDGTARSWRIPDGDAQPADASTADRSVPPSHRLPEVTIQLVGESIRISPGVFMQANVLLWQPLVDALVGAATAAGTGGRLVELFAGAGFFTLALARHFSEVVAVESDGQAVSDLRANLARGGISNVEVVQLPVEDALRMERERPDCVVLDPPRTGLAREAIGTLAALDARRIVYLSCDPATLARDLSLLCERVPAYRLTHASGFDLFPQTPHVEGLAVLEQVHRERA